MRCTSAESNAKTTSAIPRTDPALTPVEHEIDTVRPSQTVRPVPLVLLTSTNRIALSHRSRSRWSRSVSFATLRLRLLVVRHVGRQAEVFRPGMGSPHNGHGFGESTTSPQALRKPHVGVLGRNRMVASYSRPP